MGDTNAIICRKTRCVSGTNGLTRMGTWDPSTASNGDHGQEEGDPIDQIASLLDDLRNKPHSRRHIVSAWNVGKVDQMALPPCHLLFQFYVHEANGDAGLSCWLCSAKRRPLSGCSLQYCELFALHDDVAQVLGYEARDFVHCFGDTHLPSNHIEQAQLQLTRDPRPLRPCESTRK